MRLSFPRITDPFSPRDPTWREVGNLAHGRIPIDDFLHGHHGRVGFVEIFAAQRLPCVIVFVMADKEDRGTGKDD